MSGIRSYGVWRSLATGAFSNAQWSRANLKQKFPILLLGILFSVWGFSGGITTVLNKLFEDVLHLSKLQSSGLQTAFYAAYATVPLTVARTLLRRLGCRCSFVIGSWIYAIGCLLLWPSCDAKSFAAICGCTFVISAGLAILETTAITYLITYGSPRWAELRINVGLTVQSIVHVGAIVLAGHVVLEDKESGSTSLRPIQLINLAIGLTLFLLSLAFYVAPIIERTDVDLDEQTRLAQGGANTAPLFKQYSLFFGVFATTAWIGAQTGAAPYLINFVLEVDTHLTPTRASNWVAGTEAATTVGRIVMCFVLRWAKARHVLYISLALVITFFSLALATTGKTSLVMLIIDAFFRACIFPTMFSLALKGCGRHTKTGSSMIVTTVASGMATAPATGALADAAGTRNAFILPLSLMILTMLYPMYLNHFRARVLDSYQIDRRAPTVSDDGNDSYGLQDVGEEQQQQVETDTVPVSSSTSSIRKVPESESPSPSTELEKLPSYATVDSEKAGDKIPIHHIKQVNSE